VYVKVLRWQLAQIVLKSKAKSTPEVATRRKIYPDQQPLLVGQI